VSANNTIQLVGNLTAEPILRKTSNGRSVVNFRIAVNDVSFRDGVRTERTEYVNIVAWNAQAENVDLSCKTGTRVMVSGRYSQRKATLADGSEAYFSEVIADEVGVALKWQAALDVRKHNGKDNEAVEAELAIPA
jgi:single-strand DNA-binding protein